MIEFIKQDTAMPIYWGSNKPGMQAGDEIDEPVGIWKFLPAPCGDNPLCFEPAHWYHTKEEAWFEARDRAIEIAEAFHKAGYHKQIVNRILEPFAHINVLVTATDWDNWNELRDHPEAQPEIQLLARLIKEAMDGSTPKRLSGGEWHLPYIDDETLIDIERVLDIPGDGRFTSQRDINQMAVKVSSARAARVSYKTFDGKKPTIQKDLKLFDDLAASRPLHASPLEHQAMPNWGTYMKHPMSGDPITDMQELRIKQRNFAGWLQHRAFWEDEVFKTGKEEALV
jgi:hypothetical protein